jgi:hypothetical protein
LRPLLIAYQPFYAGGCPQAVSVRAIDRHLAGESGEIIRARIGNCHGRVLGYGSNREKKEYVLF